MILAAVAGGWLLASWFVAVAIGRAISRANRRARTLESAGWSRPPSV